MLKKENSQIKKKPARRNRKRGQATVEFALTTVFILILMFMILEIAFYGYEVNVARSAARHGAETGAEQSQTWRDMSFTSTSLDTQGYDMVTNSAKTATNDALKNDLFVKENKPVVTVSVAPDQIAVSSGSGVLIEETRRIYVTVKYEAQPVPFFPSVTIEGSSSSRLERYTSTSTGN